MSRITFGAEKASYDNAKAWRNLLRANRNDIAAAMNIQPNHFRWYAAFHDEGKHPHVHMMAWSTQPGEAYLTRDGTAESFCRRTPFPAASGFPGVTACEGLCALFGGRAESLPHLGLSRRMWPNFGSGFGTGATGGRRAG